MLVRYLGCNWMPWKMVQRFPGPTWQSTSAKLSNRFIIVYWAAVHTEYIRTTAQMLNGLRSDGIFERIIVAGWVTRCLGPYATSIPVRRNNDQISFWASWPIGLMCRRLFGTGGTFSSPRMDEFLQSLFMSTLFSASQAVLSPLLLHPKDNSFLLGISSCREIQNLCLG